MHEKKNQNTNNRGECFANTHNKKLNCHMLQNAFKLHLKVKLVLKVIVVDVI